MTAMIKKFVLPTPPSQGFVFDIDLPIGYRILNAAVLGGLPVIYVGLQDDARIYRQKFCYVATDANLPEIVKGEQWRFVGTVVCEGDPWHIFRDESEEEHQDGRNGAGGLSNAISELLASGKAQIMQLHSPECNHGPDENQEKRSKGRRTN